MNSNGGLSVVYASSHALVTRSIRAGPSSGGFRQPMIWKTFEAIDAARLEKSTPPAPLPSSRL